MERRIIIEKETTTKNAVGTPTKTYRFFKDTYGHVKDFIGRTEYTEEGALPFSTTQFTIRYDDGINYKCRVLYEDQYYKIQHIAYRGRKEWIVLHTLVWEKA